MYLAEASTTHPEVTLCPSQGGSRNCPVGGDGTFNDLFKVLLAGLIVVVKLLFFSL